MRQKAVLVPQTFAISFAFNMLYNRCVQVLF